MPLPFPLALPLIKSCSCLSQSYWSRFSSVRSPWSSCRRRSATLRVAALSGESIHALRMVTTSWMSWSSFAIANSWCLSGSRCQTSCASQELACARVLAQATSRGSRMCSAAFTRVTRGLERGALLRGEVFKVCDLSRCEAVGQGHVAVLGVRELMNLPGFETLVTVLLRVSRSRRPRVQRALYPDSRRSIPWSVHARETGTPVPCRTLRVAPTHR